MSNRRESNWFELYQIGPNKLENLLTNILVRELTIMKDSGISLKPNEINRS